jgi:DNA polymerase-3 subunit delta
MNGLISEIGKIGSYASHRVVTRADIDAVATPQLDAVVFQMTDAIAAGNFDKAASVLGDLLHMGEPPIKLLSVLGRQLRQLYSARLALESRKGSGYVAQLWAMRSAYPAQKLTDAARRFDRNWCRMAVTEAAKADLAMKSVSGADGEELLIELLLKLANTKPKTGIA